MELDGRPLLLSPVLPRLPGSAQDPAAEVEPPLRASDFAPRPPPLECKPLPAGVQQRLASGEGLLVALAAYSRHSQLAWCQQQAEQEQQRAEREQQAAPPPQEQRQQKQQEQQQAERPARAVTPAALPAAPAAGAGEEPGSDSLGGAPSEPLPRPCSRASAAAAQEGPQMEAEGGQPEAGDGGSGLAGLLEAELAGGDVDMLDAGEGSPHVAPPPPPPPATAALQPESAAGTEPAETLARQRAAAEPSHGALTRRLAARQQTTGAAGQQAASGAAAAEQPAAGAEAQEGDAAMAAASPAAEAAALARAAPVEAAAQAATAAADEHGSDDEELEGDGGARGQQGRKRPLSAQEAATEAALRKIGQASWEALCEPLRQRAQQAEEASGRGGRGRGRGRKGGRKGGRGGAAAQQSIRLTDVLNPNSPVYHAEFAAAYHAAKDTLAKRDAKRQKSEALKEHSKLVRRWSDLSAKDHEWFLRHQGQALVGSEAQRMALLQSRVAAEQQQYWQDVQQHAAGGAAVQRYQHASARQLAQLEDDAAQRRQRVMHHQPRLFHLRAVLPVSAAPAAPAAGDQPVEPPTPELQHVASLLRNGEAPLFAAPPDGAKLLGDRLYLPCSVPAGAAGAVGAAPPRTYRKAAVPPLADDPLVLEVAHEALSQQQVPQRQAPGQESAQRGEQQAEQQQEQPQGREQQRDEQQGQAAAPANDQQQQQQQATAAGSEQQHQQQQQAPQQAQPLFCLAGSAFTAIVCTPMLQRRPAWEIPITIQQLPAGAREQSRDAAGTAEAGSPSGGGPAIVCIDKPLQQRVLTMRAKQQRLQKYAVLSLAAGSQQQKAQPKDAARQADGEAQQGAVLTRRSARSTRSAAPAEEAAAAGGSGAPKLVGALGAAPAPLPSREASYDCWQLGGSRLLLRIHGRMLQAAAPSEDGSAQPGGEGAGQQAGQQAEGQALQAEGRAQQTQQAEEQQPQQAKHVLLALKTEYLPEGESEEFTVDELCRWWLRLLICPTADALVAAHVHVPHSKLLSCQTLTAADLERYCSGAAEDDGGEAARRHMRRLAGAGLALLQQLLGALGALAPGRYLLAHAPGEPTCCLFKALSAEAAKAVEGQPPPLPCSATLAQPGTIYDLHAAHQRSGATDMETPCFVPPRWRPFQPDIPQIPYTFPPSRLGLGQLGKQQRYKRRQRRVLPHAWKVLGEGGDFDQVHHVAQISRADYEAGLEEELP